MLGTSNLSLSIKTSNIWKGENRRCHSKNRVISVYDKTLNTHIILGQKYEFLFC